MLNEVALEFRDDSIAAKNSASKHVPESTSSIPKLKMARSTWATKVMKQKQNQLRFNYHEFSFDKGTTQSSNSNNYDSQKTEGDILKTIRQKSAENILSIQRQNESILQKSRKALKFLVNRNVCNQKLHDDLINSGILFDRMENEYRITESRCRKGRDSRSFLKCLKVNETKPHFKANFSRFTKKDIVGAGSKHSNIGSQLEGTGWQRSHTGHMC